MDATRYLPFAGRLLIALTFFMSGLSKVTDYSGTLGLISATKLPLPAPLAYAGAVVVEIVCTVLLIVGFRTRAVAAVLGAQQLFQHRILVRGGIEFPACDERERSSDF